ncbi:fibronectin type III domain-containing protein, partial [Candidatus Chlorohelix sp.]|uniref:beta strand repeat-containing protein n=1 Tax=Candidatus Chlorohelix sp. TaxID=3139201 RepID=UPI0030646461
MNRNSVSVKQLFNVIMAMFLLAQLLLPVMNVSAQSPGLSAVNNTSPIVAAPVAATNTAPVLLVYNDAYTSNKFGRYLGEIMNAEGFNLFDTTQLVSVTTGLLSGYDTVVLAETTLSALQASIFTAYVETGGNLIAMRPDAQLASVFGLGLSNGTLNNAYVAIQTNNTYGQGFPSDSFQTHSTATTYNAATAQIVALLYSDATSATSYPAVTVNNYGNGKAAAFTYDVAKAVTYIRQGNPSQTNVDADGDGAIRITDMYYNWIDLNKMPLPQADLHQRLFGRILSQLNASKKPLPRMWYFPNGKNTTLALTSDAHANPDSYYSNLISALNAYTATTTFYVAQAGQPDPANVALWQTQGSTFSTHPDNPLSTSYDRVDSWFDFRYGTRTSQTVRIHMVQWQGWTDAATTGAAHGYLMDYSPYRYGKWLKKPDNTWARGYMTGSGLPMKYIDINGQIIDYYGQYTEITDDQLSWQGSPESLSDAQSYVVAKQAIDSSENGNYQAIAYQLHVDNNGLPAWEGNSLGYARSLGIPILNADQWLDFTNNRYNSSFSAVKWTSNSLSFSVSVPPTQTMQTVVVPASLSFGNLGSLTVNGTNYSYTTKSINSEKLAFVTVPGGTSNIVANYSPITSVPVISNIVATPIPSNAQISWNTNVSTNATVKYGTSSSALSSVVTDTAFVTTHSLNLSGLLSGTTYYYQVIATDQFNNTATSAVTSFVTPAGQLVQNTYSQFAGGSGSNTVATAYGQGEVKLLSPLEDTFNATSLDAAVWNSGAWITGGSAGNIAGNLNLSGAFVNSKTSFPLVGLNLEAKIKFAPGVANQHFGPSLDLGSNWAIFSVPGYDTNNLYARTNIGGTYTETLLQGVDLSLSHVVQMKINATQIQYFVDGVLLATHSANISGSIPIWFSTGSATNPLLVDWVRINNYSNTGTFVSSTMDAGVKATWLTLNWAGTLNGGAIQLETRSSNDGYTWSVWSTPNSSQTVSLAIPDAQYLQYRATLNTADPSVSPVLSSVTANYNIATVSTPLPTITSISSTSASASVTTTINILGSNYQSGITVRLGTVNLTSSYVSSSALTAIVPAGLAQGVYNLTVINPNGDSSTLPSAFTVTAPIPVAVINSSTPSLVTNTSPITVTIQGNNFIAPLSVALSGNNISPITILNSTTLQFSLPAGYPAGNYDVAITNVGNITTTQPSGLTVLPPAIIQTTQADFQGGSFNGTNATNLIDGEIRLKALLEDNFNGTTLDSNLWTTGNWVSGGNAVVSGGSVKVGGGYIQSVAPQPLNRLQGRINFTNGSPNQHFGFSPDLMSWWLIFSIPARDPNHLYARTNYGGVFIETQLNTTLDQYHDYEILLGTGVVQYSVDGVVVATHNVNVSTNSYVWVSAWEVGAGLLADSIITGGFASSGSYISKVLDAGQPVSWNQLYWALNANGGSVNLQARTSNDEVSWSSWSTAANTSGFVNLTLPTGRYLQYQLNLGTSDPSKTPEVLSVAAIYGNSIPSVLTSIVVSPATSSLQTGATQQFTAQAFDSNNQPMTGVNFTWSTTGGGTINSSGLYTAGTITGSYPNSVVVTSGSVTSSANITVIPAPLARIVVTPATSSLQTGTTQQFTAQAFDSNNQPMTG